METVARFVRRIWIQPMDILVRPVKMDILLNHRIQLVILVSMAVKFAKDPKFVKLVKMVFPEAMEEVAIKTTLTYFLESDFLSYWLF